MIPTSKVLISDFILDLHRNKKLILELGKNDFKSRYAASYLGFLWAFVQPVITVFIFWFVFEVGFRSAPVKDVPFILWLVCGMVPWFFYSDAINGAAACLIEYSYLVKKIVFRISVIPLVKVVSSLFVHMFFILFLFVLYLAYGYSLSLYNLQVFYYSLCMVILVCGLNWISSSIMVFFRDTAQIISIVLQFSFYLTPIFWSYDIMPEHYRFIFKFNPLFYIVEGYRNSLINEVWFWEDVQGTLIFWSVCLVSLFVGITIFRKLRPHLSDVL